MKILRLFVLLAMAVICFSAAFAEDHPLISHDDANSLQEESLAPHEHISRSKWGGKPPLSQTELDHPLDLVIIAHTATPLCRNFDQCSKFVRSMQDYHFGQGMPDIGYNFLIGGDGDIYEGRGWDSVNSIRNESISVSFIGNYLYDFLDENMMDALEELLSEGVESGKLGDDYKLVCHNQTVATLSPGDNVYKVVSKLDHFQTGKV